MVMNISKNRMMQHEPCSSQKILLIIIPKESKVKKKFHKG